MGGGGRREGRGATQTDGLDYTRLCSLPQYNPKTADLETAYIHHVGVHVSDLVCVPPGTGLVQVASAIVWWLLTCFYRSLN